MKKICFLLLLVISASVFAQTGDIIVPTGHAKDIDLVIPDAQMKYVYTVEAQKIIMWNIKTGEQLYSFVLPAEQHGVSISHDGTLLAYCLNAGMFVYSTVTGKQLAKMKGDHSYFSPVFSADDKHIYVDGFNELFRYDIDSKTETRLWQDYSFGYIINSLYLMNDGSLLSVSGKSWKIFNETDASKSKEFKFESEGKYDVDYFPATNLIAVDRNNTYNEKNYVFYNILSGEKVKTLTLSSGYNLNATDDGKTFTVETYDEAAKKSSLSFYTSNGFTQVKKIPLGNADYKTKFYSAASNLAFEAAGSSFYAIDATTGKSKTAYAQNITSIDVDGLIPDNKSITAKPAAFMSVSSSTSVTTVDLARMLPALTEVIGLPTNTEDLYHRFYSKTGDKVATVYYNKLIIKDVKTNKAIGLPVTSTDDILYDAAADCFFSNDGAFFYFSTFSVPKQNVSVYRINTKTGVKEKLYERDSDKYVVVNNNRTLRAGVPVPYNAAEPKESIRVWDISTNKTLFKLDLQQVKENDNVRLENAAPIGISDDNKQLVIIRESRYEWYDIATGKRLSSSQELGAYNSTYFVNHKADAIARSWGDGELVMYNSDGSVRFSQKAHASAINTILFSENDSLLYTKGDDETIKVWRTNNGELLGTLYLFNEGKDYVFVDKDGRFDGNEGGMKQLYYLRNRQVVALDKVYEKFYTPNLYQRLLNGEQFDPISIIIKQAPVVTIAYAEKQRNLEVSDDVPSYNNTTGVAEITVNASATDDAIDEIRLFQNGKVLNLATRNLIVEDDQSKTSTKKYTVSLLPGNNEIRAIALNTQRTESEPDVINVVYANGAAANTIVTPINNNKTNVILDKIDKDATLHLMVVGINAYQNPKMSLNYALADATAFKEEVEKDAKTVITNTKTYFITDAQADKNGISTAFMQVQQLAKPKDVFIFYYAGHGVIADGNKEFYLVPNNVTDLHNVDEALKQNGIAAKDLQQYAINIQAQKQLFILDACQSAGAFADLLSSDGNQQKNIALVARSTGTHWMAASGSQQFANEFSTLGHGAFTYVLLQALKGEAAANKMITVDGLKTYMQNGVPALMKKYNGSQQTPASYGFGNDFPVEIVK